MTVYCNDLYIPYGLYVKMLEVCFGVQQHCVFVRGHLCEKRACTFIPGNNYIKRQEPQPPFWTIHLTSISSMFLIVNEKMPNNDSKSRIYEQFYLSIYTFNPCCCFPTPSKATHLRNHGWQVDLQLFWDHIVVGVTHGNILNLAGVVCVWSPTIICTLLYMTTYHVLYISVICQTAWHLHLYVKTI